MSNGQGDEQFRTEIQALLLRARLGDADALAETIAVLKPHAERKNSRTDRPLRRQRETHALQNRCLPGSGRGPRWLLMVNLLKLVNVQASG